MIHKIIAILFIVFAAMQYNDPDFYIWMPLYLVVAGVAILYDYGKTNQNLILILAVVYFCGVLLYIPDVISWIQSGTPTIAGSMKAESPFIEFVREFFGLVICLVGLIYYWKISKDKKQLKN